MDICVVMQALTGGVLLVFIRICVRNGGGVVNLSPGISI